MNQLVETSTKLDVYFEGWHIKRVKRQVEKEIKSERDFKGQKTTTKEITTEVVKVEPKLVVSKRKQVKIEGWSDNSIPVHQLVEQLENSKGHGVAVAPGDGHVLYLPVPPEVQLEYGLLMRDL